MKITQSKPGVFTSDDPIVAVSRDMIEALKDAARRSPQKRARFCAHPDNHNPIHEMLIVLARDTYICPHKHPAKSESFHVIEGLGKVVIFDEAGQIVKVINLGDDRSGRSFFYRISAPYYHTVIVESDSLMIHETTNGPFRPEERQFAPWAPSENDTARRRDYMGQLKDTLAEFPK